MPKDLFSMRAGVEMVYAGSLRLGGSLLSDSDKSMGCHEERTPMDLSENLA